MREILFRGKRTDDYEWIEGSLCTTIPSDEDFYTISYFDFEGYYIEEKVIPETVGQYTGLTDKNGKKIFEGDIVVCKQAINGNLIDYYVEIGFVEMKYGAFGLHRKQGYYRPFKDWLEDYEYEVIGNIHDNPELLKVGDENDT